MATEYLPNQPIIFTDNSQQGLNNDTKQWSVLLQQDDVLSIQQKLIGDGTSQACSLDALSAEVFTTYNAIGTGWTKTLGLEQYNHTGGTFGDISSTAAFATIKQYHWLRVEFTVEFVSGGEVTPYHVNFSTNDSWTGKPVTTLGTHVQYIQAKMDNDMVSFIATGAIRIANPSVKVFTCSIGGSDNSWINDWNTWTKTEEGSLCHIVGNTAPVFTTNSLATLIWPAYYKISVTISGRTQGSLSICTDLPACTDPCIGNGTFVRYYQPPLFSNEQVLLTPDVDFDGCVSDVLVEELEITSWFRIYDENNVAKSDIYTEADTEVTIVKDRITFTVSFDSVRSGGGLIALSTGCYKIGYNDPDNGFKYSQNLISYNATTNFEKTKMFFGTCIGEGFGFLFEDTNFDLWQRLPVFRINPKYEFDADEFIDSQGVRSKSSVRKEKLKTLWVDYIDEIAHDCLSTIINCDTVELDGEEIYFPVNDYEPEWEASQKYNQAQVKIDVKFVPAGIYNKNC
jgi:hypothetical protein